MKTFKKPLHAEAVKTRICDNLMAAGVLLPDEVEQYRLLLDSYNDVTLVAVLICSHELREETTENRPGGAAVKNGDGSKKAGPRLISLGQASTCPPAEN